MPRPSPLALGSTRSYRPDSQTITPRTPHSLASHAEEEAEHYQATMNPDYGEAEASLPLLLSLPSDSITRLQEDFGGYPIQILTVLSHLPLVMGVVLAGFLFFLAVVSYMQPDQLRGYLSSSRPGHHIIPSQPSSPGSLDHENSTALPSRIISYENYTKFPLLPSEYLRECHKVNHGFMRHRNYWEPHRMGVMDVMHHDERDGYKLIDTEPAVCTSTITYMLDGEVGLFADLALMAQAAALARERNRTLLVDDTYWNRGKWKDYFQDIRVTQPGPEPGCGAPPPRELVACPRLARHWVINSRTAKFHFGHGFSDNYEDPYAHQLNRLKPIFKATVDSFKQTILPNKQSAALIESAKSELSSLVSPGGAVFDSYIAVHIRRGDRKPAWYRGRYVPAENFVQATTDSWARLNPGSSAENPFIYVASDSASAYQEILDLTETRYQTMSLFRSKDPELRALASREEYVQNEFNLLDGNARIRATRGVIVDFALVSGTWANRADVIPAATVCTISSNICKLSAVGLGWERAFGAVDEMGNVEEKHKRWVEIDQKGQIIPVWEPFELFY